MTAPPLAVVVPAYNAADTITGCVTALRQQHYDGPVTILVVDDGSTDDTAALARAAGATVITTPVSYTHLDVYKRQAQTTLA